MRLVIQNVLSASVDIEGKRVAQIGKGFLIFVGFTHDDDTKIVDELVKKVLGLRVFPDENGKTNLSLTDIKGEILSVSQFTLYGDVTGGRRPSFVNAMPGALSSKLYDYFNFKIEEVFGHIEKGVFGADMKVSLVNDGPFTLIIDSKDFKK